MLKIYFLAINLFAMIIMFVDKKKAIKKHWRISEFNLLLIALLGGSIGEYIGMYLFRHKTKHIKFTLGIPVIFLLQILILISFIK
ncbi:DUF1294 domain-containing protein [Clostridium chauvoei]|uniref:DUF1294 domain-containing protein n=1 Tax=Clostridium chauvoei TaxID=46867 RepID=UPI0035CD310B